MKNRFKQALKEGTLQIGLWQALADPYTAEICAGAGFDWLLFDAEHGPNDIRSLLAQLQSIAPYPTHPIARPPASSEWLIKQYLDIGFQTLLIPFVDSREHAEALVASIHYPPDGMRGVGAGLARAARWGRVPDYLDRANGEMCLIAQIETVGAIAHVNEIARVAGVDGIFIGASDLAAALGHRGNLAHPDVRACVECAIADALDAGQRVGCLAPDMESAAYYRDLGCTFIAVGTDVGLLAKGSTELAKSTRVGLTALQKNLTD